ncbi:MAG: hypothetical protein D3925_18195, partial [Candidatus Electrothrix sp. AR5]|nr:hypothetical protein [Candidatus Electrothrix sp. AR5]
PRARAIGRPALCLVDSVGCAGRADKEIPKKETFKCHFSMRKCKGGSRISPTLASLRLGLVFEAAQSVPGVKTPVYSRAVTPGRFFRRPRAERTPTSLSFLTAKKIKYGTVSCFS